MKTIARTAFVLGLVSLAGCATSNEMGWHHPGHEATEVHREPLRYREQMGLKEEQRPHRVDDRGHCRHQVYQSDQGSAQ